MKLSLASSSCYARNQTKAKEICCKCSEYDDSSFVSKSRTVTVYEADQFEVGCVQVNFCLWNVEQQVVVVSGFDHETVCQCSKMIALFIFSFPPSPGDWRANLEIGVPAEMSKGERAVS